MSTTYRIDIDGVLADPAFYDKDVTICIDWYLKKGIITSDDVKSIKYHQQLFLMPQVLLTHQTIIGSLTAIRTLTQKGGTLQYFTVRQSFHPEICKQVHSDTMRWLEQNQFPFPTQTRFFWSPEEKLLASLEAEESSITLIDDRPDGLIKAYQGIEHKDPETARHMRERITLVAFGYENTQSLIHTDLHVVPLANWNQFDQSVNN